MTALRSTGGRRKQRPPRRSVPSALLLGALAALPFGGWFTVAHLGEEARVASSPLPSTSSSASAPREPRSPSTPLARASRAEEQTTPRRPAKLPGVQCEVDRHGIRVKALIKTRDGRCLDRVPEGQPTGAPLAYFQVFYVFDRYPQGDDAAFFLIGDNPTRASIRGWVPAASVALWPTRVGVRYRRPEDQTAPPLVVYRSHRALVDLVTRGRTREEPLARARFRGGDAPMPWPVTKVRRFSVRGRVHEAVKVDFLGRSRAERPTVAVESDDEEPAPYSPAEISALQQALRRLDVVFVVDNTLSTRKHLDAIREAVSRLASDLHETDVDVQIRLRLVLFRDYVDGILFEPDDPMSAVRAYPVATNLAAFQQQLEPLDSTAQASWEP